MKRRTDEQSLHDRLLVRRIEKDHVHTDTIAPDTGKGRPTQGEVVAVGIGSGRPPAGRPAVAIDVRVGDRILFGKYSGTDVRGGVDDLVILHEDEFLVVLD